MTTNDSKVKRLLDGDIDEEEIASDPVLASLAERIFGLNIEPITPTKPSLSDGLPPVEVITAKTTHDSMIEVVPGECRNLVDGILEPKQIFIKKEKKDFTSLSFQTSPQW